MSDVRLITIGENLKRFEKYGGKPWMDDHPEVDWTGIRVPLL